MKDRTRQVNSERSTPFAAEVLAVHRSETRYPTVLETYLGARSPQQIFTLGDPDILRHKTLALFCSVKCPGNLILRTYDLARQLRDAGTVVISGFHSPMEKECLSLLLRGNQPVVWCMARRFTAGRLSKEWQNPIVERRLLMLSPFGEGVGRVTKETAQVRNEFVAALAHQVFVAYAAPGGKTEAFCRKILEWHKPLFTFAGPENAALLTAGARPHCVIEEGSLNA